MELSAADYASAWAVLMAVCAAIVAVGGAVGVIVKLARYLQAPQKAASESIDILKEHDERDYRRLDELERAVDEQSKQNRLMIRGLLQLITHEIDGNHVDQLKEIRDDFEQYLIERR